MEKEKMMECAMQIIAYAGSAFDYFNRAIEAAEEGQLEEARQYLADGKMNCVMPMMHKQIYWLRKHVAKIFHSVF